MARLTVVVLLLVNAALAAWLWHDLKRPEPNFTSREKDADAIRVAAVVPPSQSAARAAARQRKAGALADAPCVSLVGLSPEELPGVRAAIAGLGLGDRAREAAGPGSAPAFVFRDPDAALLAWLGRLQRGLDDARLDNAGCPGTVESVPAAATAPAPVEPPPGRRP